MDLNFIKDIVIKDVEVQSIEDVVGEGYSSNVKLKVKLHDGTITEKSYFLKSKPKVPIIRKLIEKYRLMEKEISMYEEMIPGMEKVVEEYGDTNERIWCNLLGYRHDMMILEDLREYGYMTVDKMECLDYKHVIRSVSTLGRFHAISKVFFKKDVDEEKISRFRNYPMYGDSVMLDMFTTGGLITMSQVMKKSWGPKWLDVADRLYKSASHTEEYFKELFQNRKDEMDVLNHGDLWCCNVMFQYDSQNVPVKAKFVDFQLSHFNSLAWDLTFLLYTSVRASVRRKSLPEFLDAYFKSLSDTLDFYGYEGPRPTRKSVGEEMDRFKYMGLTVLCSSYTNTATNENNYTMQPLLQEKGPRLCYFPHLYEIPRFKSDVQEDLLNCVREGIL
ncbi:uncharacterized protein LOC106671011 [Cimex lectularius]|uniref:CHK kinase-like domain-containing protein n=1 Tax=Cimex lectularius TaxID=79782 RepID=A0A8I6SNI1_CIMLE|nr:uncharacterized protein LOC106671011 [Cimex lectularius]